jgi:uncharacterized coiled-coil protein SlyX
MDQYPEEDRQQQEAHWLAAARASASRGLVLAVIALLVVSGIAFAYGYYQHTMVRQLTAQAAAASQAMNQMQGQVNTLTARLNELPAAEVAHSAPPAAPSGVEPAPETPSVLAEAPQGPSASAKPAQTKHPASKRRAPVDKRYAQLQAQLAEQQKQLNDTQQVVEKNRSELERNINSTRDELNGSIAKTHEELVALEKRGERNYYEFDLSKSKQFQRVGPLSLSLRKADMKHNRYDLAMIVDDNQLTKKQVNLYEPISIHTDNGSQAVMVVVNKIEKDLVHGYISTPKYKPSELAAAASVAPAAGNAPAANSTRNSPPPPQPQQ